MTVPGESPTCEQNAKNIGLLFDHTTTLKIDSVSNAKNFKLLVQITLVGVVIAASIIGSMYLAISETDRQLSAFMGKVEENMDNQKIINEELKLVVSTQAAKVGEVELTCRGLDGKLSVYREYLKGGRNGGN